MSMIKFFWLIDRLNIVQLSQNLKKYLECSDWLFNLLGNHQVIVIHKSLPQVWIVPPGRILVSVRRVDQTIFDLRALNSSHRILIQSIVIPVLAGLFGD